MENKLAAFIVDLATSPEKLTYYKDSEEDAMEEAGLNEQERNVLRSGNWKAICEFLGDDCTRPLTTGDQEGAGDQGDQ